MDEKGRKLKLQTLLERQKLKDQAKHTSLLFDECIAALGDGTIILSKEKTGELYKAFESEFNVTFFGRVEWSLYEYEEMDIDTLKANFANEDKILYLIWSHGSDPVIQVSVKKVLEHLDDVTAVSPDIWLYSENGCMIEIFHDGIIRTCNCTIP